jgi:NAD+ kinase
MSTGYQFSVNGSFSLDLKLKNCYTFHIPPLTGKAGPQQVTDVEKIGILYHPKVTATRTKAREIERFLKKKGLSAWAGSAWDTEKERERMAGADLLITVGGDGTILRAIQVVIPEMTPILSVNLGNLGFMTELPAGEALARLPDILDKGGWLDERAMLQAELVTTARPPQVFHALNDVVVARGEIARLIRVEAGVDGEPLTTYRADGVVVATATGSTGYALAAGGPIIYPQSQDLLLAPVAPHLSLAAPLLLPPAATVTLRLDTYLAATLSVDGHINLPLASGDTVTVTRSPYTARFLRVRRASFFRSLEKKLKGK